MYIRDAHFMLTVIIYVEIEYQEEENKRLLILKCIRDVHFRLLNEIAFLLISYFVTENTYSYQTKIMEPSRSSEIPNIVSQEKFQLNRKVTRTLKLSSN